MKNKKTNKSTEEVLYPSLIFVIWLVSYIVWDLIVLKHNLGWDEVSYMSLARGIAEDFDFSSRQYTIMGLLKHGYPSNFINYPIHSMYLAVFFKLFGTSLYVAYFSTWLAALGVCLLIYYIFLLISENSHKIAFLLSMAYLYAPGTIKNCNTAMMEQLGCFLLCLAVYLILKDYKRGEFDFLTILKFSLSFLILWLYKSLHVGFFFGAFLFICFAYSSKFIGKRIETKIPLPVFLILSYGIFSVLYFIFSKYIFLPVAPMMNFSISKEETQTYADFLGGFLNDFSGNFSSDFEYFFKILLGSFFLYPSTSAVYSKPYEQQILTYSAFYIYVGFYFFLFFIMLLLTFANWRKFSPIEKLFVLLSTGTIISFNLIFDVLFTTNYINIWRYNYYSVPLYVCYLGIVVKHTLDYFKPFNYSHPIVSKSFVVLFFVFIYVPLFLSVLKQNMNMENLFHGIGKTNSQIIKAVVKDGSSNFIYFNDGVHTTFVNYPIRWVFKDATNEQLEQVNKILPEPIEYLFLKPTDWLFNNNQELISKGAPILNGQYNFYGHNKDLKIFVYKLNKEIKES